MRNNPFLKVEKAIIKRVFRNKAMLNLNVVQKEYSSVSGEFTKFEYIFTREIYIKNPYEIADAIVDGKGYLKGDLTVDVAFKEIADCIVPKIGDPVVMNQSGVVKTISDLRNADGRTAGIDTTSDTIVFAGTEYNIVKITPKNFYCGMPTVIKLQMRAK